jgi:hypothetical protein
MNPRNSALLHVLGSFFANSVSSRPTGQIRAIRGKGDVFERFGLRHFLDPTETFHDHATITLASPTNSQSESAAHCATCAPARSVKSFAPPSDAIVQTQFTLAQAGQWAGLVARYAYGPSGADSNMYWGTITNTGVGYAVSIRRNSAGTWTQLAGQSVASPQDQNMYSAMLIRTAANNYAAVIYRHDAGAFTAIAFQNIASIGNGILKFQAVGTSPKLFIDGALIVSATDSTFDTGSVGIRSIGGATFDNFSATKSPLPLLSALSAATDGLGWDSMAHSCTFRRTASWIWAACN